MGRKRKKGLNKAMRHQVKGILILALALFCFVGLFYTEQAGGAGHLVNRFLRMLAGNAAVALPLIISFYGIRMVIPSKKAIVTTRLAGFYLLLVSAIIWMHLNLLIDIAPHIPVEGLFSESIARGLNLEGGGVIGGLFAALLIYLLGPLGSRIIMATCFIISAVLILNISLNSYYKALLKFLRSLTKCFSILYYSIAKVFKSSFTYLHDSIRNLVKVNREKTGHEIQTLDEIEAPGNVINSDPAPTISDEAEKSDLENFHASSKDYSKESAVIITKPENNLGLKGVNGQERLEQKSIPFNDDYLVPSLELLSLPQKDRTNQHQKSSKERAKLLETTLLSFGVRAKVIHVQSGPTVTRFEVQPEAGVKVSKIISLSDDLALNLAAPLVRIEAPIPGKAALGIEVPNKVIDLVNLREVIEETAYTCSASELTIGLGKDITGDPVIADLTKMPHLLIAGATGAGKSVCLNTIITSILYKAGPEKVRFLMIDPKVVELSVYNGIPHLLMPVLTDPRKAALALRNMVREMGRRYDLFAELEVRDISTYNEMTLKDSELEKLPYIVVIIDELADLMLVSPGEVEDSIARLAQMSRAAGIHLVVATQRPSVDVLTGIIKANITSRIAFTVSSQFDSRTILDMSGAEKLLGRGDMLFYPVGAVKPFRVQGAYISEIEVKKITDFIKAQGQVDYEDSSAFLENSDAESEDETDALFAEAVDLVVRTGQASISLLQRRFRIGYTRAARLIDDLERRGIVGQFEGSKPREVLVTQEQAAQICEEFNTREN